MSAVCKTASFHVKSGFKMTKYRNRFTIQVSADGNYSNGCAAVKLKAVSVKYQQHLYRRQITSFRKCVGTSNLERSDAASTVCLASNWDCNVPTKIALFPLDITAGGKIKKGTLQRTNNERLKE